jgi:hypothetical protein
MLTCGKFIHTSTGKRDIMTQVTSVTSSVHSVVAAEFAQVAQEHSKNLQPLSDHLPLLDSGLDSLCFAIVVARLEDRLGLDPFASDDISFPVTFGDFVRLYDTGPA